MAFVVAKSFFLLSLISLIFVGSFASGTDDDFVSFLPPMSSPAPVRPPINPYSKPIEVEGRVYRRFCNKALWFVDGVSGATVQMQCNINGTPETYHAITDLGGYFFLEGPKSATILEATRCRVSLGPCPSDLDSCGQPSIVRGGASGVSLMFPKDPRSSSSYRFNVGPWIYEAKCA